MGISISKKGQQLSKSPKSNKYTLPTRQQLVTQHACTGGATTKPDVTTIVVTTQTTKILLSQFANYNYLQIFKIRKFLYFLCSIAFFMFQLSVWNLYWVSCLYCICIQSLSLSVVVNSLFKLTVECYWIFYFLFYLNFYFFRFLKVVILLNFYRCVNKPPPAGEGLL